MLDTWELKGLRQCIYSSLACVASVSSRVRRLGREQKNERTGEGEGNAFFFAPALTFA